MFFLRSCSALAVCLVSTFVVVYISHCDSVPVFAKNYLSTGLIPMINDIIKTPLSQLVGLEGLFKSNCSQNEVDPEKDLNSCINTVIDFTATVSRLRKSPVEEFTGELSSVFKEFCRNRTILQQCFQSSYQESSHCWMDGIKKNWPKIIDLTNSVSGFACSEEGDRVAQYLAGGGSQCLLAKEEDIKVCFNKTVSAHIPAYLYATTERKLDEEDCDDIKTLQRCALKHLEMCETQSTAIFVNNTLNTIWSSNCLPHPAPVLERAEIQGDLNDGEGGLLGVASDLFSLFYVVADTVLKSAVGTLTSSNNTAKEASPELDTNDDIGSSDSKTPLESTRQINKEDVKDQLPFFQAVEGNSAYVDDLSDVEGSAERAEDYYDDEIKELPSPGLGTNATDHDPTDASKADIIVKDKLSNFDEISVIDGTNITRMPVDFTTSVPPVDHASILNHTTLLVISSYVVLSLVIIILIMTLFCENILPQAD